MAPGEKLAVLSNGSNVIIRKRNHDRKHNTRRQPNTEQNTEQERNNNQKTTMENPRIRGATIRTYGRKGEKILIWEAGNTRQLSHIGEETEDFCLDFFVFPFCPLFLRYSMYLFFFFFFFLGGLVLNFLVLLPLPSFSFSCLLGFVGAFVDFSLGVFVCYCLGW